MGSVSFSFPSHLFSLLSLTLSLGCCVQVFGFTVTSHSATVGVVSVPLTSFSVVTIVEARRDRGNRRGGREWSSAGRVLLLLLFFCVSVLFFYKDDCFFGRISRFFFCRFDDVLLLRWRCFFSPCA